VSRPCAITMPTARDAGVRVHASAAARQGRSANAFAAFERANTGSNAHHRRPVLRICAASSPAKSRPASTVRDGPFAANRSILEVTRDLALLGSRGRSHGRGSQILPRPVLCVRYIR